MSNIIPMLEPPMGFSPTCWKQPDPADILVDDRYALMTQATFNKLARYDHTIPTGVYPGKMWARRDHGTDWLAWYSDCDKPGHCKINRRLVLIA